MATVNNEAARREREALDEQVLGLLEKRSATLRLLKSETGAGESAIAASLYRLRKRGRAMFRNRVWYAVGSAISVGHSPEAGVRT